MKRFINKKNNILNVLISIKKENHFYFNITRDIIVNELNGRLAFKLRNIKKATKKNLRETIRNRKRV